MNCWVRKIENENVASDVAEQLSRINEQLAIKNRRSRRIWKIVAIILAVIVLVNIFIADHWMDRLR